MNPVRIAMVGNPGTGKTSLARALAYYCRTKSEKFRNVELVSEYARIYIDKHNGIESIWEQYRILNKQIEWEDSAKCDVLVTDSPIHLNFAYSIEIVNWNIPKDVMVLNDIFKKCSKLNTVNRRYDVVFYLPTRPGDEVVKDGIRIDLHFDKKWQDIMEKKIEYTFNLFPPKNFIKIKSTEKQVQLDEIIDFMNKEL